MVRTALKSKRLSCLDSKSVPIQPQTEVLVLALGLGWSGTNLQSGAKVKSSRVRETLAYSSAMLRRNFSTIKSRNLAPLV